MFVLFLAACSGWIDQSASCGEEPYAWSDDLLGWILTGDGSGAFDLEPDDEYRSNISGTYDPSDGEFDWKVSYVDGFYLKAAVGAGFGTVYHSGDLDLEYDVDTTDILGDTTTTRYRVIREGCEMSTWAWDPDGASDAAIEQAGAYDANAFSWTGEDEIAMYAGSFTSDLDVSSGYELASGNYNQWRTFQREGTTHIDWAGEGEEGCVGRGLSCEGVQDVAFDGSTVYDQTVTEDGGAWADMHGEYSYNGDGEERQTYYSGGEAVRCDLTVEDGDCTYSCDDGTDGKCD